MADVPLRSYSLTRLVIVCWRVCRRCVGWWGCTAAAVHS